MNKTKALKLVAEWVISCDNKEYGDYVQYCDDNDLDAKDIYGEQQLRHVYALALIGLGRTFPKPPEKSKSKFKPKVGNRIRIIQDHPQMAPLYVNEIGIISEIYGNQIGYTCEGHERSVWWASLTKEGETFEFIKD